MAELDPIKQSIKIELDQGSVKKTNSEIDKLSDSIKGATKESSKLSSETSKLTNKLKIQQKTLDSNSSARFKGIQQAKSQISLIRQEKSSLQSLLSQGKLNRAETTAMNKSVARLSSQESALITIIQKYRKELSVTDSVANKYTKTLNKQRTATGNLAKGSREVNLALKNKQKTVNNANQILFSFGDAIQDGAQFQFGFAQGARAIGNNLAFAAEQFALTNQRAGGFKETLKVLGKSFLGPAGIIVAINAAITAITVFSSLLSKSSKKVEELTERIIVGRAELEKFADKGLADILNTGESAVDQLEEIDKALEAVRKRTSEFRDNEFKNTLIDSFQSDATNPVTQLNAVDATLGEIVKKTTTQDVLEIQAFEAIKKRLQERRAELQAQILINRALDESVEKIIDITEIGRVQVGVEPILSVSGFDSDTFLKEFLTLDRVDSVLPVGSLASDLKLLEELNKERLLANTDAERQAASDRIALLQEEINRKKALYEEDAQNNKIVYTRIAGFANNLFSSLNQLNQAQSDESEKQARKRFNTAKKLARSQAMVNTAAAFADTLREEKGGAVKKIVAASLIGAAGALQIKAINKTTFEGGGSGGAGGRAGGGASNSSNGFISRTGKNENTLMSAISRPATNSPQQITVNVVNTFDDRSVAEVGRSGSQNIRSGQVSALG